MEPHYPLDAVPWSLDICSTQRSTIHRVEMHGASNQDTHLCLPHSNLSVFWREQQHTCGAVGGSSNGFRSERTTLQDSAFWFQTPVSTHPEWPSQEEPGSGLTASAPVSDVYTPACKNGVWPPLRPVSVAQKNKPLTMSSSNVQSIDLPIDCTAWRLWMMKQPNGYSTPAPKSSAANQWMKEELAQTKEGDHRTASCMEMQQFKYFESWTHFYLAQTL